MTTSTRTSISEASSASRLKDELAEVDLISDVAELRQRLKKALTASDGATARGASRLLRLRRRSAAAPPADSSHGCAQGIGYDVVGARLYFVARRSRLTLVAMV